MNSWIEIQTLFLSLGERDRLEWLVTFGDSLPALDSRHQILRDAGRNMVQECFTPVYLCVEIRDEEIIVNADVPKESAVVRGFVALLKEAFEGMPLNTFLGLDIDPLADLGVEPQIGTRRRRGLRAVFQTIRNAAEAHRARNN